MRNISRKYEKLQLGPNISHLVMIKTPTNHSSSRQDIVFRYVENHVGIGMCFDLAERCANVFHTSKSEVRGGTDKNVPKIGSEFSNMLSYLTIRYPECFVEKN